jgi:hypothetical protein
MATINMKDCNETPDARLTVWVVKLIDFGGTSYIDLFKTEVVAREFVADYKGAYAFMYELEVK